MTLSVSDQAQAGFAIPLTYDTAFDSLPVINALENLLARWSISVSGLSLAPSTISPGMNNSGLGLGDLMSSTTCALDDMVRSVVSDPLFGGNIVKARGENGDTEVCRVDIRSARNWTLNYASTSGTDQSSWAIRLNPSS